MYDVGLFGFFIALVKKPSLHVLVYDVVTVWLLIELSKKPNRPLHRTMWRRFGFFSSSSKKPNRPTSYDRDGLASILSSLN